MMRYWLNVYWYDFVYMVLRFYTGWVVSGRYNRSANRQKQMVVRQRAWKNTDEMTYFKDLELAHYHGHNHGGPHCADDWKCSLLAVGWLEKKKTFSTGSCSSQVVAKLSELRHQFGAAFPQYSCRGLHECSMCRDKAKLLRESHVTLFIPGKDVIYMTPGRVDHYIDIHSYAPPQAFVDAVLLCPDPGSPQYEATLRRLNGGQQPPLWL